MSHAVKLYEQHAAGIYPPAIKFSETANAAASVNLPEAKNIATQPPALSGDAALKWAIMDYQYQVSTWKANLEALKNWGAATCV